MGIKHYDKAFKAQASRLIEKRGNLSQVSRELGVSSSQLARWRRELEKFGENSFPGRGIERPTDEQRKIKKLGKQLEYRGLDIEILKKAITFFSRADD